MDTAILESVRREAAKSGREAMNARVEQALGWLSEASGLMDQAIANMRKTGYDQTRCDGFRRANLSQLLSDLDSLIANIKSEMEEV